MALFNVICLNLAALLFTLSGVVDPAIWGSLLADLATKFINTI